MRTYALENRGRAPLYEYLYRCIRGDILDGTLTAGERLPSKRALAEHLHISVMTVEGAYQQLEAEGYVYTRRHIGGALSSWHLVPSRFSSGFCFSSFSPAGGSAGVFF